MTTERPYWREGAGKAVSGYAEGLDQLASALEFAAARLHGAKLTRRDLSGAGSRGLIPILAARAIGTVDAIHALLLVGRVEQADMLVRTLIDLQADAHLLVAHDDAIHYYVDWATVEQARQALQMRPNEVTRPGRNLDTRRQQLADELVERLRQSDPNAAEELEGHPLDHVLPEFCRSRFASRRPSSWRTGYLDRNGLSKDDLREIIIATAARAGGLDGLPEPERTAFQAMFERELELLFSFLSGEIHNSPLSMDRLVDADTEALRTAGDIGGTPRPLLAAFQHLVRIMLLFEQHWTDEPAVADWSVRASAMSKSVGDPLADS